VGSLAVAALVTTLSCTDGEGDSSATSGVRIPTSPADLAVTVQDLSAFGEKRAGTEAGRAAGAYVRRRFEAAGLRVDEEEFHFPRHDAIGASLSVTVDGTPWTPELDVLDGAATKQVEGEIVPIASARPAELEGVDLTGKIALVGLDPAFHRSAQLRSVVARGAAGFVYVSTAPDNLRQVGTVRAAWEPEVAVPAVTIGAVDGERLRRAVEEGRVSRVALSVEAKITPATARNVVARIDGTDPAMPVVVVGAHYDTWFSGAADNGGGVAALVATAERWSRRPRPTGSILFVAYDAEELGLYGGYEFLRRHVVLERASIAAVVHFETPAAKDRPARTLARSRSEELDRALEQAGGDEDYRVYLPLGIVPAISGGSIPTDIRGMYRAGIPTILTSESSAYYHTLADTPDKVDVDLLARAVDHFDGVIEALLERGPTCCRGRDPDLWRATVTHAERPGGELAVDVAVVDVDGLPVGGAAVEGWLLYDDFFPAGVLSAETDGAGRATLVYPAPMASRRGTLGKRFLDVTAGRSYPLAETLTEVP
jgi:hypothetical protein